MALTKKNVATKKKPASTKKTSTAATSAPKKKTNANISKLIDSINAKFGDNALTLGVPRNEDGTIKTIQRLSTGCIALDVALGGGLPIGRYIEISGMLSSTKTTLCIHILKEAQKMGMTVAWFDVEGTTDEPYFKACGVQDVEGILYCRPDGMEEALQMADVMARSGMVQLIVIDSIAMLSPTKEQSKEMDESMQMGIAPKILGEYFRKLSAANNRLSRENKQEVTVIGINQIREKIGAYGDPEYCLHYDTMIPLTDGRSLPIGKIVEEKIEGKVWSLNETTGEFEEKEILDWKDNGVIDCDEEYYHIETEGIGSKNGRFGITVTYDHKLLTDSGWKPAEEVTLSDKLATKYENYINGSVSDFLYGTLVGDSSLVSTHKNGNTAFLRLQDSDNPEYLQWKVSKLNSCHGFDFEKYPSKDIWRSKPSVQLNKIKNTLGNRNPLQFLRKHFSTMGLAVWYFDDGHLDEDSSSAIFSVKRYANNPEVLDSICKEFGKHGYEASYDTQGRIRINAETSKKFFDDIKSYTPDCMQYKLPEQFRGAYTDFELSNEPYFDETYARVLSVRYASAKQLKKRHRYDIKVGDNHNFLAGGTNSGVIVHNTPGGRAKGFAQSIDIRLRRGDWITEGTGQDKHVVGQAVKFKIEKNKTFKRMQTGEMDFYFDKNHANVRVNYYDNMKSIVMLGVQWGLINKSGAWFTYGENKYQGVVALVDDLRAKPEMYNKLHDDILALTSTKLVTM